MNGSYCVYPPQLADDVEITEQRDGDRLAFIAGSASVGRYILLREAERRVLSLLEWLLSFSLLHFYAGKTGTEKCRTEKYGPMISQIFIEPFRAGFLHEELRAAGEFSPIHLISEPENLQKENFERAVIWREIRQLHLVNHRDQLAKSVPTEASA
jgi:hypothetical protein